MTRKPQSPEDWSVGMRVWLERAGRAVLGPGRLELLEGIDREHSISAAARQMGMSYRHAWLLVQDMNEAAGECLVEAAVGGQHGGGARLTAAGREAMRMSQQLQSQLRHDADAALTRIQQKDENATGAVHVAAAISLQEVLGRLLADFTAARPDIPVRVVFGASDELADYMLAGAPTDLFLSADEQQMERLVKAGAIESAAPVALASNSLTAIAAVALPVRRATDLLRPSVARIACAKSGSPLGNYSTAYLKSVGIYDALRPRLFPVDNAGMVMGAVHSGQADVGLVYGSEVATSPHCCVLFRAARTATPIRFLAAVVPGRPQAGQARLVLNFLTSISARQRFRECGFLPAV